MQKRRCIIFILLFMLINVVIGLHSNQPRFRSENGHLYIESAMDHNISLNTKGQGYLNVNNENILQVTKLAREAWGAVESFRINELSSFSETIKNVAPMIDGPKSLSNRVAVLEMQMLNSSSLTLSNKEKGKKSSNMGRLETRLANLEKKIANLVSLLTTSECLSNPCKNGGTCMDLYNGFQCNCPDNWEGRLCEVDVNECVRFIHTDLGCQNGAECKNTPGSYECICAQNWFGLHCTKKKNDCNLALSSEMCGNGLCINQVSAIGGYTCICNQGWTTDGSSNPACTVDIDECKENKHTCSVNPLVECRNTRGSFSCENCPIGYEGDGFLCTDINECLVNNGGCSMNPRVQCINTRGSFKCEPCPPGYTGDGFNCIYMLGGACAINNGGCHPDAVCTVYAERTIQCTCPRGYRGSGFGVNGCVFVGVELVTCENDPCGSHGLCVPEGNNNFSCICDPLFTGKTCNIRLDSPCSRNPCHEGECVSGLEPGNFTCNCPVGYFGQLCESVQEECGGYLYDTNGTIRYPKSNTTYQSNLNCAWEIEVDAGFVLNISFSWIDIEKGYKCHSDSVEVINSDYEDEKVLAKLCGNTLPVNNSIVSDSNLVIIRFHSDHSKNYRGFQLNYTMIKPICGGVLNVDSHGTLSSPGSPGKYPANRDCFWTLNATPGNVIQFFFYSLQFEHHTNCSYDYLEIRDGTTQFSPVIAKLCNNTTPSPILTSGPHALLHFHSDNSGQDYGFQLMYSITAGVPGCGGIYTSPSGVISSPVDLTSDSNNYLDSLNCEWHIKMPLNQKLKLMFIKKFSIEMNKNCSVDYLEIHDGPNFRSPLIGRYCGTKSPDQPIITSSNEVTIIFKSDFSNTAEGFTIKYETFCGGTFTDSKGIIESPYYPNPYPQNKICIYLIEQPVGKAIQLSFLDMDIEDLSYPKCFYDSLEIKDGDNENSTTIALLCGSIDKLPKQPYISTHNFMWLKFTTDHSNTNKGFRANYSTIDITCGGILKEPTGVIQSSKNLEKYLHNQMCKWIISVNETSQIKLSWSTFSLEDHATCQHDYVEIYDNSISGNASKIARYCGSKVPPVLTSLGNRLTIIFKTDRSLALDGFMLSYVALSRAQVCGGNFYTSEGFIKSPNFPNSYPNLKDCIWVINVPVAYQIELNISQFSLEQSTECRFDFLEIRNGGSLTSPLIGKYCGSKILNIISSMSNSLFIRFKSDSTRVGKGFYIQWYTITKGCGGTLNTDVGHIISPNYPLPVLETMECFYKIVVPQGNRIKLSIVDIEMKTEILVGQDSCRDDFLEFYDGGNSASKLLGSYCSEVHSSELLQSSSNQMYIKFRSSGFSKGRGFSLSYKTDCNVTIKGYQGAIELPKGDNFMSSEKCAWTIVAPKSSKINITFTSLTMYHSRFTNLLFSNITSPTQSLLKNYCFKSQLNVSEGVNINEINTILLSTQCNMKLNTASLISSTKNIVRVDYEFRSKYNLFDRIDSFRLEWIVYGCGGKLDQYAGEFTSPEYPGYYPPNSECEWNINVDYGYTIEITIQDFWFETSHSCTSDYLAIYSGYDDSGLELLRLCHKQLSPITITVGGNQAFVRFVSDTESQRKGFQATYKTETAKCGGMFTAPQGIIHSPNYPHNYDSNTSCTWYIEIAETHLVNLTFVDFSTRISSANKDLVLVYDGDLQSKLLLNHSGNSLPPTIISSSNKLLVLFEVGNHELRSKGFKAIYSTACGAKIITNDSGIITSHPSVSNMLHDNCTWTIISDTPESKVTLTFSQIDIVKLENNNIKTNYSDVVCSPELFHTIIRVLDGPDSDAPEITKLCKSYPVPPLIVSNGPAMRIEFTDNSGGLDAFTALYSVRSIACGGTYDSARGTISTPGYPNNYLSDSECVWILKSSVGNRVSLNFIVFELEENEFCNEDYVEIREKDSIGPLKGIYCGPTVPTNDTLGSSLWIKFRSNSNGSAKGFTADFGYVTENYFTQKSGELSSPMYPRTYRHSDDYSWSISVGEGKRLQLVIKELMITSPFHYLKIYDGWSIEALLLFDGSYINTLNQTIISSDNTVFIQLKATNVHLGGISFLLAWTEVDRPNTEILNPELEVPVNSSNIDYYLSPKTNNSIIITSPGYPNGYEPNLNITYTIHTDPQNHIEVDFHLVDLFSIESSFVIYHNDYVNVQTMDPDTGDIILLKTVDKNIHTTIVGKNKVFLNFITNNLFNGTGFQAEVKSKCGGKLRGPSGLIDLSNVTQSYISDLCIWNVTVRPGRTIEVKLKSMYFLSYSTCGDSYVLFKNGFYEDSLILGQGKYCKNSIVSSLSTTGNTLQVHVKMLPIEKVQIEFEEKSVNCGGQIDLNDVNNITQITSPFYPNIPPAHVECIWRVVAPSGERISVSIEDLNMSEDYECKEEYIEFRDGAAQFSKLLSHICRPDDIMDIETTDNFLYIKYFTDLNVPSTSFKLNVTIAKCGGIRRGHFGTIFSPNYPGSYESNMDCEYRIIVDSDYRIVLNFDTISLKRRFPKIGGRDVNVPNNDTYDDSLTIFDIEPINKTKLLISKIYGSNIPSVPIKSLSNELIIKFKSQINTSPFYSKTELAKFAIKYSDEYDDCSKHFTTENGEITSHQLPSFGMKRLSCVYTIKVPIGRRITIEITKGKSIAISCNSFFFRQEKFNELLIVFQGNEPTIDKVSCLDPDINSLSSNYIYESSMNEIIVYYEFKNGNQIGFHLKYSSGKPSICGGLIDTSVKGNFELSTQNLSSIFCRWDFPNTNGTVIIITHITNIQFNESKEFPGYNKFISFSDENSDILLISSMSNQSDKFTILSPLPMIKLLVNANRIFINFTVTFDYYINNCGGVIDSQKAIITSPNYPKNYQQITNCAWLVKLPEGENINIHFNDIDLESSCDNNYIKLHDGNSPKSPVLGKYCGNKVPDSNIIATSNEIWIEFSSDSPNSNKRGFNLTLEPTQLGCGMIYTSESGELFSKNYPNLYPNNDECEWTIAVLPGNKISLEFVDRFNLEQSVNCTKDYVQIFDYVNNDWFPLGDRLCGRHKPPIFNSSETKMKIRFRSNSDKSSEGFKAQWNSTCGGIFTESTGKIISPNYPMNYPSDIICNYTILSPGKEIQLTFKSFSLEDAKCRFDNLTIYTKATGYRGRYAESNLMGTYCGKKIPTTLTMKDNVILVFKTDSVISSTGFEIHYASPVCGGEISTPGQIKSPISIFDSNKYPSNVNCTWIIRAPPNQVVRLDFTEFQLESSSSILYPNCKSDNVSIFDEVDFKNKRSPGIGVYCGILDDDFPKIVSKTNVMYVQFLTDDTFEEKGFIGEVSFVYGESSGCGGTIRFHQSNITSTYTLKPPKIQLNSNFECRWLILAESSYAIQIQLVNYTESPKCPFNSTDCRCSSIEFFDGPGPLAFKIHKFCSGNNITASKMSSASVAFIQYSTFDVDVDVDFEIKITPVISNCGLNKVIATNQTQILTSPNYPLPYENNLDCTWTLESGSPNSELVLSFIDMDLGDSRDCLSDFLEVNYQSMFGFPQSFRLCHESHKYYLSNEKPVNLRLHTDDQKTSKGFKLLYSNTKCPSIYSARYGHISLPYDSSYYECMFSIILDQSNLTISAYLGIPLTFSLIHYDLMVYDGPNVSSPLIFNFTNGNINSGSSFSTGPAMTFLFKYYNEGLLDLSYTSTDHGRGCGGKLLNMRGTVTSPMYPFLYKKDATCVWDIAVPRPHRIQMFFHEFDLGSKKTCDTNYLELYNFDPSTNTKSFVAKYCGTDNPAGHFSLTGSISIRYVTTIHNTGSGWLLSYSTYNP